MRYGAYKVDPLRNVFPRNPTQTSYLRFLEDPSKPPKTAFEESREKFEKTMKMPDLLKTYYTDILKEDDND